MSNVNKATEAVYGMHEECQFIILHKLGSSMDTMYKYD
jgi:hypothetical protein